MSFRTLTLLHTVLCNVQTALAVGSPVNSGVLGDFNAGVTGLVLGGREPSDMELSALTQLGRAVTAEASAAVGEAGDVEASSAQVTETSAGEPAPAEPAAEGEALDPNAPAAGDDSDGA